MERERGRYITLHSYHDNFTNYLHLPHIMIDLYTIVPPLIDLHTPDSLEMATGNDIRKVSGSG